MIVRSGLFLEPALYRGLHRLAGLPNASASVHLRFASDASSVLFDPQSSRRRLPPGRLRDAFHDDAGTLQCIRAAESAYPRYLHSFFAPFSAIALTPHLL